MSVAQDAFAIGIIGAAATAAGGIIYGSHMDLVKGAGLAAGTTGALNSYTKPKDSSIALLNAADKMICIAKSGRSAEVELAYQASDDANASARQIMDSAIREARIALRKALVRDVPDYASVLNKIQSAAKNEQSKQESGEGTPEKILATLQSDVDKCLLIPGA